MKSSLKQQGIGFVVRCAAIRHCEELFLRRGNPEEIFMFALAYNERKLDPSQAHVQAKLIQPNSCLQEKTPLQT
jgi:hypothetical protein